MLVLHAIWDNSTLEKHPLNIWAEDSDLAGKSSSSASSGRKPAGNKAVLLPASKHPFTIQVDHLKETLHNFIPLEFIDGAIPGTFSLRLPSDKAGPLPSPELILKQERISAGKVGLAVWGISCLA